MSALCHSRAGENLWILARVHPHESGDEDDGIGEMEIGSTHVQPTPADAP